MCRSRSSNFSQNVWSNNFGIFTSLTKTCGQNQFYLSTTKHVKINSTHIKSSLYHSKVKPNPLQSTHKLYIIDTSNKKRIKYPTYADVWVRHLCNTKICYYIQLIYLLKLLLMLMLECLYNFYASLSQVASTSSCKFLNFEKEADPLQDATRYAVHFQPLVLFLFRKSPCGNTVNLNIVFMCIIY